jgi:hypothetical protein
LEEAIRHDQAFIATVTTGDTIVTENNELHRLKALLAGL